MRPQRQWRFRGAPTACHRAPTEFWPAIDCVVTERSQRARGYGKPFEFLFIIYRYRKLFSDIGNPNSRYNSRYREIIPDIGKCWIKPQMAFHTWRAKSCHCASTACTQRARRAQCVSTASSRSVYEHMRKQVLQAYCRNRHFVDVDIGNFCVLFFYFM